MPAIKIIDEQVYSRDTDSKALIATDKNALQLHRKKIKDASKITSLERELNSVKKELEQLKGDLHLLKQYVNHNDQHKG